MIVKSRNGKVYDDTNINWRQIKNSVLYNAMADINIEKFNISILEDEIDDDLLNPIEKSYIDEFDCQYPNGFNMTNGGGSKYHHAPQSIEIMKRIKRENVNDYRHETIHDMPQYFTYETKLQAIILQKHPLCAFKGFYIRTHGSLENAKKAAIEFWNKLETSGKSYEREKKLTSPYKGVYETPKGSGKYYVSVKRNGKTYRKAFSYMTPDENKQEAINFAKNPIIYHQQI